MKLSDVKVGMRVAVVDFENELAHFGTVKLIGDTRAFVDHSWYEPVFLRKVKPKKSVISQHVVTKVVAKDFEICGAFYCESSDLSPLIGKRVHVKVTEIKS